MKGMCENATRKLTWLDAGGVNLRPIYFITNELKGKSISVELRVLRYVLYVFILCVYLYTHLLCI